MSERRLAIVSDYPVIKECLTDKIVKLGWKVVSTQEAYDVVILEIENRSDERKLKDLLRSGTKVILFTQHPPSKLLGLFFSYEFLGLMYLKMSEHSLQETLNQAYNGQDYFDEKVLVYLMSEHYEVLNDRITSLSDRELEIIESIFSEKSNAEIADLHNLSVRTVNAHKRNILQKTGSRSIVGLYKLLHEYSLHV